MKHAVLFLLLLTSCGPGQSKLKFQEIARPSPTLEEESVDFDSLSRKILTPKCLGCHSKMTSEEALQKWVVPGKPEKSRLFTKTESGAMPPQGTPLSTAELEMIKTYIEGLTPESFAKIKDEILTPSCLGCHGRIQTEADLKRWVNFEDPERSKFYLRVKDGSMPKGGSPLSLDQQDLILRYVRSVKPLLDL